jgi:hypothetical protein
MKVLLLGFYKIILIFVTLIIIIVLLTKNYYPNIGLSALNGNDNKQPVFGVFYSMELIITTKKGEIFVVIYDEQDHEALIKYKWHIKRSYNLLYAQASLRVSDLPLGKKKGSIKMHRYILGVKDPNIECDHIDGNGLNNSRSNLRLCNHQCNSFNMRSHKDSLSIYKGAHYDTSIKKWRSRICVSGKSKYLGVFKDDVSAAIAYNAAAIEAFGEFAKLNKIIS